MWERILEWGKAVFLGIVEGVTEWLPVSSTGHMLLVDEFLQLQESQSFKEMFFIVIQLGAIFAVVFLFWDRMFPFQKKDRSQGVVRKEVCFLWLKVIVSCIPGAVVTLLFDDLIDGVFHNATVIAGALIFYGIAFIGIEKKRREQPDRIKDLFQIGFREAFWIGLFQVLSLIPGTSRSGSTIVGARLLGISRAAAAEFTFFLAVPVMLGYSAWKFLCFGFEFTAAQICLLLTGCLVSFVTSLLVVGFLMNYVKKHSFAAFGWYRIFLGAAVLFYFLVLG